MNPLPSNNFTDSNGDVWFCTESGEKDLLKNMRTGKKVWRRRSQLINADVKWNEPKLYKSFKNK